MSDLQYRNEKWLREQFKKYKTPTEVSKQTGYPRTCITRYAKKFGIYTTNRTRVQKLHIKSDYFKNIDTFDKAYFLGVDKDQRLAKIAKMICLFPICSFTKVVKNE